MSWAGVVFRSDFPQPRYWFATRSDLTPTVRALGRLDRALRSDQRSDQRLRTWKLGRRQRRWENFRGRNDAQTRYQIHRPVVEVDTSWYQLIPVDTSWYLLIPVVFFHFRHFWFTGHHNSRSQSCELLRLRFSISQLWKFTRSESLRVRRQACSTWDRSRCSVHTTYTTSMPSIRRFDGISLSESFVLHCSLHPWIILNLSFWKSFWIYHSEFIMSVLSEFLCQMVQLLDVEKPRVIAEIRRFGRHGVSWPHTATTPIGHQGSALQGTWKWPSRNSGFTQHS